MRKPWIIALLSLIPGLGLIILGEYLQGVGVVALVTYLGVIFLFVPWEIVSITSLILGIIIWSFQLFYTVIIAQRLARIEKGLAPLVRQTAPLEPLPPGASFGDKRLHKARQTIAQLLHPGEHLRVALEGVVGSPSLGSALLDLISGTAASSMDARQVYIGITKEDFILVHTDLLGKPSELQRIPLNQVALIKYSEGLLSDEVIINIGEVKPLSVRVGRPIRQGIKQLKAILLGKKIDSIEVDAKLLQQDQILAVGDDLAISSWISGKGLVSKHPILLSALLGLSGGVAGTVAATILSLIIVVLLDETIVGTSQSSSLSEGLGYLLGIYCLIMFPWGGGIIGAIPGVLLGALRVSQAKKLTLIPLFLAGFLPVVILTLAAFVALLLSIQ